MYFYPRNKYLHVEVQEEKAEDTAFGGFVLPADYKRQDNPLKVVKLVTACKNSEYVSDEGSMLIVPAHTLETIKVDTMTISLVPEHVVLGVLVKV